MKDKVVEILIRMIKEVDKLRGFTFYKDQYETPPFVKNSEMIELHSLLNKKQMPEENKKEKEEKKELINFEDVVKDHVEANQNLWKVVAILLKDVHDLQKKFKQIEEAETKSL
jgi:hypothetical protein